VIRQWASRLSITWKIVIASLVGIALFHAAFMGAFLPMAEDLIKVERRMFLKERTDMVLGLLHQYQADADSGAFTLDEARRRAAHRFKSITTSAGEYFWILEPGQPSPQLVMHPVDPTLQGPGAGQDRLGTASEVRFTPSGKAEQLHGVGLLQAMSDICRDQGAGFVSYTWPKAVAGGGFTQSRYPKESYVVLFAPWNWIIGTGEYMDDLQEVVAQLRNAAFLFLGLVTLLVVAVAGFLGASITRPLRRVVAATQAIALGDLDARSGLVDTSDELDLLSRNFDEMASQLRQREQAREAAERARRESERKIRAVFDNAFQLIWLLSPEGNLLECNQSALDFIEGERAALMGRPFWDTPWWSNDADKVFRLYEALASARAGEFVRFETSFVHPRTGLRVIDFSIKTALDESGAVQLLIPEGRDITEIKMMERMLAHRDMHDPLTGLANRTLITDRILHALQVARRKPGTRLALLYIDINRFKIVNDSLGHMAGDAILRVVASRIKDNVREMDTVARYGGDDFVVLLWELASSREAIAITRRIKACLSAPIGLEAQQVSIKVSIGMDLLMNPSCTPDDVVRNAHLAMSHSKSKGRGFIKVYTPSLLNKVRTSLVIESEMERGIERGEFFLQFQPIMDMNQAERLAGVEALCRWRHPERGLISPEEFIPVAEETGLIVPLGEWVLDAACASMAELAKRHPECPDVFMAVNLSPRQLERTELADTVQEALERHGVSSSRLHLEVTETSLMSGSSSMIENIHKLKGMGVRMVVDDFGVGYSNLALLTNIRFSAIKIDRSLVRQIRHMAESLTIIKAIVTMAESLDAAIIVEGVETASERDTLKCIGCNMHQGFLYSPPVDFEVVLGFARSGCASCVGLAC